MDSMCVSDSLWFAVPVARPLRDAETELAEWYPCANGGPDHTIVGSGTPNCHLDSGHLLLRLVEATWLY